MVNPLPPQALTVFICQTLRRELGARESRMRARDGHLWAAQEKTDVFMLGELQPTKVQSLFTYR
jgi:hypothetical protein